MRPQLGMLMAAVCLCLVSPVLSNAQAVVQADRANLVGEIGFGRFGSGRFDSQTGLAAGGGAQLLPFTGALHRLGFEADLTFFSKGRTSSSPVLLPPGVPPLAGGVNTSTLTLDRRARLFAGDVVYHFREARTQPYVRGGFAYVWEDYHRTCSNCSFSVDPVTGNLVSAGTQDDRSKQGKVGFSFGGGVKIALGARGLVRAEGRLAETTAGSGPNWGWASLQVGLGVRL